MASNKNSIPKVTVLNAISPRPEDDKLVYPNLEEATKKHVPHQRDREEQFWRTKDGSLEEKEQARQIAMAYLLMTSLQQNNLFATKQSQQLWADRFTKAAEEIYGAPEPSQALGLLIQQSSNLVAQIDFKKLSNEDKHKTSTYLNFCNNLEYPSSSLESPQVEKLAEIRSKVGSYLEYKYKEAFSVLPEDALTEYSPAEIVSYFELALTELASSESEFSNWSVVIVEGKDLISVNKSSKKVQVGANRRPVNSTELKGLFAHEVLVHAMRAVNGSKIDEAMGTGLPDYLDFEEGLGTLFEFSITGKIPEKNVDRYIDIAYALGLLDGYPKTRAEVMSFARSREFVRCLVASETINDSIEQNIESKITAHVNRIFRGTTGDDIGGVFTKDIAYQRGFNAAVNYISSELKAGKDPSQIVDFLLQGKFDPTIVEHLDYLKRVS